MKIHQLDLNATENTQSDPVVDDSLLNDHNHDSAPTVQPTSSNMKKTKITTIILFAVAIGAGIATGFGSHKLTAKQSGEDTTTQPSAVSQVAGSSIKAGDVFGSNDAETFINDATGYLEKGGIDGEGSHKLLRIGGESQTVYLTSSVTDLDKLVGMEVKVWGETFSGQKAGWLMDVGRVEVIETEALPPTEE